jgi:ABC-type transporter Mla subunit MlaD
MRRILAIVGVLACATALVVVGTGASNGGGGGYEVRAIFRNAFALVAGEDVKISGVKVGSIKSLDLVNGNQAAVVLSITRPGFQDFRKDGSCTIRPQGLIGERFVECTLTQPHPVGQKPPPPLDVIAKGKPGAGQRLLPVTNTARPVDIDLVNNILRLPYRERLGIIINEFGTGLAGRGQDLSHIIREADPALKATDQVLALLASQNRVLADLAKQSDISLAPLARERAHIQGFVTNGAHLATATAEKSPALKAQFAKLPTFLSELRPTMARLSGFADEATPVVTNLRSVAPEVSRLIQAMGPFAASATPALVTLGKASVPGRKALVAARDIVGNLGTLGRTVRPLARSLAGLTTSFKATGGVERLMDYLFYQVSAINGFDQFGHYLRASLILNTCTQFATVNSPSCSANFQKPLSARSASTMTALQALHQPGISLFNRRTAAVLRGMSAAEAIRLTGGTATKDAVRAVSTGAGAATTSTTAATPAPTAPPATTATTPAPAPAGAGSGSAAGSGTQTTEQQLLDYLLGGGG